MPRSRVAGLRGVALRAAPATGTATGCSLTRGV